MIDNPYGILFVITTNKCNCLRKANLNRKIIINKFYRTLIEYSKIKTSMEKEPRSTKSPRNKYPQIQ